MAKEKVVEFENTEAVEEKEEEIVVEKKGIMGRIKEMSTPKKVVIGVVAIAGVVGAIALGRSVAGGSVTSELADAAADVIKDGAEEVTVVNF